MPVFEHTLVRSKLLVPSPAGLLHRSRICASIERGLACKLTMVCAPAGYGKTSALVDFAQHSPMPVCWYTADERDRDLGAFIEYLVGAICERFPGFGRSTRAALASLSGNLLHDPTGVAGQLVNEILEITSPFVVVVDNYEALEGAFGIRTFVHRLLEVLPFNCHLMLGSRVLADVPVTHLVAKRQLIGLTAQDLRFTPQEIRGLLQLSRIEVSESQAQAIAANSEGWITGVLLLADLLRERAEATLLDAERATVETYEYLAREVLLLQPPDIQDFLRTSAVLREMSSRLCREVLQIREPRALLMEVERRNLFVTRFGRGTAATYRYHNLFRSFLHEQLRQREPAHYAELHRRAAERFERDNDIEEAVYHHLAAEVYPDATALMERVAMEWFTRGRVETLLRWAGELPEEARVQAPRLSFYQSTVLGNRYDYDGALQALAHAEAGFTAQGDVTRLAMVRTRRGTLRLFEGRYEDAIAEAQTALGMLEHEAIAARAEAQRLIGKAHVGLGHFAEGATRLQEALLLYRQVGSPYDTVNLLQDLVSALTAQGRFDEASACLDEAIAARAEAQRLIGKAHVGLGRFAEGATRLQEALLLYRQVGSPYDTVNLLQDLVSALTAQGRFDEASACLDEALAIGRRLGAPTQLAGVLNDAGCLHYARGEYREALALYEEGMAAARRGGDLRLQAYISVGMADLYRDVGAYQRAARLYNTGWQIAQGSEPGLAVYILAAQADMYRWQGDHARALASLKQGHQLAQGKSLDFEERGMLALAEGIVLAEGGEVEAGLQILIDAIRFLEQRQAKRELARARFLLAKAHSLAGDKRQAIAELGRMMTLAEEIGTDQFAVVEGQHAEGLLRSGVATGMASCRTIAERVQRLRAFGKEQVQENVTAGEEGPAGRLEIYALGEERVTHDGYTVASSEWQAAMAKELFFYILLHGPLERGAIGVVFWPDLSTKRMADSFHTTLYRIRRAVGANAVVMEGGQYRLGDVDYWFDVEEFETLVGRARLLPPQDWQAEDLWRRAVALYRGDFLTEVERVWCVPKREQLREMYVETLIGVGRCHEARREFQRAIDWYRLALGVNELREDVHRRIMHCYTKAGRRSEALAQYHRCREILRQELDIEPSAETRGLYERITGKRPD